jgi:spectinomycin phosphotransferase/16S rRNA (guanine(1405)-N(7))-methyltransferase
VLTPPTDLSDGDLAEVIGHAWGVAVASLDYRPVGFGSHHWVTTDGQGLRHFVTVDQLSSESRIRDEVSALGLHLRRALEAATDLRAFGCSFVVAPIPTRAEDPFFQFGSYAVALYPFIEGRSFSFEDSFGEADRDQVLAAVLALHRVPIAAIRPPETERFVVPWLDKLDRSMHHGNEGGFNGPHAAVASQLLIDNEVEIKRLIARYRALVAKYLSDPAPLVITHGEIHPGNVMEASEGWVIVDWDTVLLAPRERDLWRLAQGSGSVLRAYGDATGTAPTEWLIDLFGIRWDLAEIASFAAQFQAPHEDTEDSQKALGILRSVVGRLRT